MQQLDLVVKRREPGKPKASVLRSKGIIPGVYYSKGENIAFSTDSIAVRRLIYTAETHLVNLCFEGEEGFKSAILKDVTFDPVTDKITHFDMIGISADRKLTVEVPVMLKGTSIGVREGGILQHNFHKLQITCLPEFLPNAIEIDITGLGMQKTIYVKDIQNANLTFALSPDTAIVSVASPRVIKDADKAGDAKK
jgi:large subunit ribosomal protein L25